MNTIVKIPVEVDVEEVRKRALAAVEDYESRAAAGREADVPESTFLAFLNDKYAGDNEKVARKVDIWLRSREERAKAFSRMPEAPAFQMTPTAQKFLPLLTWAQVAPDFTAIVGSPGIGKTRTLEHYRDNNPHVFLVTAEEATARVNPMLQEICHVMGIEERSSTKLSRAIGARVKNAGALIIMDEAQKLTREALDQLRALHDKYKVGVAVCGNRAVLATIYGGGQEKNAQLFRRLGMKERAFQSEPGDLDVLIAAWGVTNPSEVAYLQSVAKKFGALGNIDKTMKLATLLASGAKVERTIAHIEMAWGKLKFDATADV
ncbi:AAA family ATPase [Rhodospirillum sp. A1_3_36]|uniref:AAA family ATPase n=1 Tax=Rhodospirillum sp. A1_3_36 TaxID=3391666 RepID=UPI0039A5686B